MSIPLRAADAKPLSKFHGPHHEQLRMGAKMRQAKAFGLFLEGKPLAEIADEVGVHYSSVWRYIKRELDTCRVAVVEKVEAVREQQIHRLDRIIAAAWEAWQRSCRKGKMTLRVTATDGPKDTSRERVSEVERTPGDVRYLDIMLKALAEQRVLLGIGVAPSGLQVAFGNGQVEIITQWGTRNRLPSTVVIVLTLLNSS